MQTSKVITILCILAIVLGVLVRLGLFFGSATTPYWEEVAIGYDALSIAKTGADHHGNPWPLVAFESFGDWKPSLYFYAVVPFVKLFGLSVEAVRLPSLVSGLLMIAVTAWIGSRLAKVGLLSAAVTALSPWGIHFSRAGWEAHLATVLIGIGVGSWLESMRQTTFQKKAYWFVASMSALILSLYAYHGARGVVPILGVLLLSLAAWRFRKQQFRVTGSQLVILGGVGLVLSILLLLPFLQLILHGSIGQLTLRAQQTSMIAQNDILGENIRLQQASELGWWSKLVYHRYLAIVRAVAMEASTYLDPTFLVIRGEDNPRHGTGFFGILYPHELMFLILGCIVIWKRHKPELWLLFGWIGATILVASYALPNPHALRILLSLPAWMILIALGLRFLLQWLTRVPSLLQKSAVMVVVALYVFCLTAYTIHASSIYPRESAPAWQAGYQEIVATVAARRSEFPDSTVVFSRSLGRPAMYYWFYTQTDPRHVQTAALSAPQDQGELLQFENMWFEQSLAPRTDTMILAGSAEEIAQWLETYNTTHQLTLTNDIPEVSWQVVVLEAL